jgi:hypothetical protein
MTVANTIFEQNSASRGGAIEIIGGPADPETTLDISDSTFISNEAAMSGGALYILGATVTVNVSASRFVKNESAGSYGAAAFGNGSLLKMSACRFSRNFAVGSTGALSLSSNDLSTVTNCVFEYNRTDSFGGAVMTTASPALVDCLFAGNEANSQGGALVNFLNAVVPIITNCTFVNNVSGWHGGAIYNWNGAQPVITNCVFWQNSDDGPGGITEHIYGGAPTVNYSFTQYYWSGAGGNNLAGDPGLYDVAGGCYRIDQGSQLIDAGDNTIVPPGVLEDLDGHPRFVDDPATADTGNGTPPIVDMGAFEFGTDCNGNGIPDACEAQDCNWNGVPDDCDISGAMSADCNGNGEPDECEIDRSSQAPGGPFFCTENCDPDCNESGTPDSCDVAGGGAGEDCNNNSIPDECEIDSESPAPGGPFFCTENCDPDCNDSGTPDACDVFYETSNDCNVDGIPDECAGQPHPFVFSAAAEGSRYIGITPEFSSEQVAFKVFTDKNSPHVGCLSAYVQVDGSLGEEMVMQAPEDWCRVHVNGPEIIPETTYYVSAFNGSSWSSPSTVTTWKWGDVNNDGFLNATDWQLTLLYMNGSYWSTTLEAADVHPPSPGDVPPDDCVGPNSVLNFSDVQTMLLAWQGNDYPCPSPVPGPCPPCQSAGDCDDGMPCTADTCVLGECFSALDDSACPDNGLFCDGEEVCDPVQGCVSTGDPCQPLFCNEELDRCGRIWNPPEE